MQYKNILVYLDQGASNKERVNTAIAIATEHNAQLTGVVVNALPNSSILSRLGIGKGDALMEQARVDAQVVIERFEQQTDKAGVKADTRVIECLEGKAPEKLARMARIFDLSIMRQANPDKPNASFIAELSEEVMFSSGRPVFFMPYIGAHNIPCKNGLVAWDGSKAATRAIHDALPILEMMDKVVILIVDADKIEHYTESKPGEELSRHLSAHGVNNSISRIPKGDASTSTVILNELSDTGADILIMGGYGTPKLREVMLGGVTRTLFECMTVPVFMSH
ncbi:MAG: universal stress protein [Proteobacteria bacterium]|nr:universal stress protein [Pseudomonadota bacterium]